MSDCRLLTEYEKNITKYLRFKHEVSRKSHQDRKNRVKKFLKFCCLRGVKTIKDITQVEYDNFIQTLSGYSIETRRKYQIALKEFFKRAKLPVRVNVQRAIMNAKLKKFQKLLEITQCECLKEHKDEILKLL